MSPARVPLVLAAVVAEMSGSAAPPPGVAVEDLAELEVNYRSLVAACATGRALPGERSRLERVEALLERARRRARPRD